ncbi:MAG: TonB-dependent receptor [Erythrobacter sp.]
MAHQLINTRARSWRRLALGTASSLAIIAVAAPVMAQEQDADEPDSEETEGTIIVSGFRASLASAQNIKRNADTFVDAITAEDIGALPDRSVAEALQRVPGINIGRFEKASDPDRFSVEGTGVIIRGLPFVRSELNGRDIFSATGGRELSFNDVSPELLGKVEVFKNVTADMIEGAIAGTVNLGTRRPLDRPGFHIGGTLEGNYGDLAQEWSPGISVLASNTFESGIGTFGLQLGYANSTLINRTDASQITDPCYRAATLDGPCQRVVAVGDGGFGDTPNFDASNFPPAGSVLVPKGAGVRTTRVERDRQAYSAVGQFQSNDRSFRVTVEWLRADAGFATDEAALLAQVNDDALFPIQYADRPWQFDSAGIFQRGLLTQSNAGGYASPFGGIPMESLRFQRGLKTRTEDISIDIDWAVTDRFRVNFEAQRISSDLERNSILGAMNTWADIALDATGRTPKVEFLAPRGAPSDIFLTGQNTYYWFLLDSIERNDGDLDSLRFDAEYDLSDDGFFKRARFGARWAERNRTTRDTNFSTWGNLSAPWAGRAGCLPWGEGPGCGANGPGPFGNGFVPGRLYTGLPGQEFAVGGGAFVDDFPAFAQVRTPFARGFQRGVAPTPIANGAAWFFGGDDFLGEYLSGTSAQQARAINDFSQTPNPFFGVNNRNFTNSITGEVTACDPFCEPEINIVTEITKAAYGRIDFGHEFKNGWNLVGNFGVRYVQTKVRAGGLVGFPNGAFFDDPLSGGNGDGIVQVEEVQRACQNPVPGIELGYCSPNFPAARLAEFAAAHTGEILNDDREVTFDHWLPSFNARLDVGGGLLFRFAVSKGISRPDLQLFRSGGAIVDNTGNLLREGTLADGPLFQIFTGNRNIRPVESWNYDLSLEWYFNTVGQFSVSLFAKDLQGIVNSGFDLVPYTSPGGTTLDVLVNGPINADGGTLKGFEIAHQQTYTFLPGLLSGFGTQFSYTHVDGSEFGNSALIGGLGPFAAGQPLNGISKHTVNATLFYEKGNFSARTAYNWRSEFLITQRDDIFPFSPIWQEASGQMDASIFYSVNKNLKLGIQGVNLLDEVTQTSQVVDFDGTRITRSAFRNDRRFTFLARFDF